MKKQTLNEEISRIKGIMGMIVNEQFEGSQENAPSEMAKKIASDVLSDVVNIPIENYSIFYDNAFDGSEIMFAFGDEGGILYYHFDVDFSSGFSSSPASYYEPASESNAEYDFKPKYIEVNDGTNVIYKGKDFTNIMNIKLSNGKTVEEYVYDKFDEEIQIWSAENPDEQDPDNYHEYRDRRNDDY